MRAPFRGVSARRCRNPTMGRDRHFYLISSCEDDNFASSRSDRTQSLLLDGRDLVADLDGARHRPAALARRFEDRFDALEDATQLGLHLEHRAHAGLARLPGTQRVVAQLAAL